MTTPVSLFGALARGWRLCCGCLCVLAQAAESVPLVRPGDRIAIFGDSISAGKGYGFIAADLVNKALPDLKLEAFAHGHPGWRSDQALTVVDAVLADKPTVVTIMFGTNDIGQRGARGIADLQENLGRLVARFKAAGVRVILLTPPYTSPTTRIGAELNAAGLPRMGEAVVALGQAEQVPVFDMFAAMGTEDTAEKAKNPSAHMFSAPGDCHPSPFGHQVMGAALAQFLLGKPGLARTPFAWKYGKAPHAKATRVTAPPHLATPFPGAVTMRVDQRDQVLEPERWRGAEALSAAGKAVWDDTNLFVEVEVTDATRFPGTQQPAWGDDGIEFFVDTRPAAKRDVAYAPGYFQFLVPCTPESGPTPLYAGGMDEFKPETARGWCGRTANGYIVRIAVPWALLRVKPGETTDIGLDIALNDKTGEKTGRYKMLWRGAGDDYTNAGATGTLELAR